MEQAAIWWWIQHQQKKRSYIRSSHLEEARQGLSFKAFWRYYNSSEVKDLKRFLRVTKTEFEHLYSILECQLGLHSPTHLRPIARRERLAVFLRFLSFGPNYAAVATLFAIGDSTVQEICREVSSVIIRMMQAEFLPVPTRATWLSNAERFLERRQFPKTLGAIDGKHIALVQPDHAGALFYNYKKFNSIVLLAIADSDSRFIAVDTVDMVFKEINDEHKFFLCECVEEKSVLWDPSHPEHHLAGPKMSAWLKIDEAFKNVFEDVSFGTAVLKETWTSINTTHRTTMNRVQGKTGDGTEDTEPTWKFWMRLASKVVRMIC